MRTPGWLENSITTIERSTRPDLIAAAIGPISRVVGEGAAGPFLRGDWLGHALHPLLTDFPLGCWSSASILDFLGGRRSRRAAQTLVGVGLLATLPTAAAGLAEYNRVDNTVDRRVGAVHAIFNGTSSLCYVASWRARRNDQHLRGVLLATTGGLVAVAAGYLGGHLSFTRRVGTGPRGLRPRGVLSASEQISTEPQMHG